MVGSQARGVAGACGVAGEWGCRRVGLQADALLDRGAGRLEVECSRCGAQLAKVQAMGICRRCHLSICSACILKYNGGKAIDDAKSPPFCSTFGKRKGICECGLRGAGAF